MACCFHGNIGWSQGGVGLGVLVMLSQVAYATYNGAMAQPERDLIEVKCPCCEATLQIDPALGAVIRFEEHKKPPVFQDMEEAVQKLRGEEARRGEVFDKKFEQHKSHQKVLDRKFDELLKQAKENPDEAPPKRPFDFD